MTLTPHPGVPLDQICSVPNPVLSLEDWQRFNHQDLDQLQPHELLKELQKVRSRLFFDPKPHPWLKERQKLLHDLTKRGKR